MGKYFVMSTRFDKNTASDFGFISRGVNEAINPKDHSLWIKTYLYDFGWGSENGFYRYPLPNFEVLIELVLYGTNRDDVYGAASVILEKFGDELLLRCESLMSNRFTRKEFRKLVEVFGLKVPANRSSVIHKNHDQIQKDYKRWLEIAEKANTI